MKSELERASDLISDIMSKLSSLPIDNRDFLGDTLYKRVRAFVSTHEANSEDYCECCGENDASEERACANIYATFSCTCCDECRKTSCV